MCDGICDIFPEPFWKLEETLDWVAFRDSSRIADAGRNKDRPSGDSVALIRLFLLDGHTKDQMHIVERDPERALMISLRNGTVCATGRRGGYDDPAVISADQWALLEFTNVEGVNAQVACAFPVDRPFGEGFYAAHYWSHIRFRRETLIAFFKPVDWVADVPEAICLLQGKKRSATQADATAFYRWATEAKRTIDECKVWAAERGLSRDWVRIQRKLLPPQYKRGPGEK